VLFSCLASSRAIWLSSYPPSPPPLAAQKPQLSTGTEARGEDAFPFSWPLGLCPVSPLARCCRRITPPSQRTYEVDSIASRHTAISWSAATCLPPGSLSSRPSLPIRRLASPGPSAWYLPRMVPIACRKPCPDLLSFCLCCICTAIGERSPFMLGGRRMGGGCQAEQA